MTPEHEDNLLNIKGIGPSREQWLRETFGVHTYADLARLSIVDIAEQLKKEQIVSSNEIASWIEQAKQLVESSPENTQENDWHPSASFVVEVLENVRTGETRTRVHHMDADETMEWPGIAQQELTPWMVQRLGADDVATFPVERGQTESATPPLGPAYSEELQRVLANAATLQTPAEAVVPPVPQPTNRQIQQGEFSEELRRVLANVAILQESAQRPAQAVVPPASQPTTSQIQHGEFNEELQRVLSKARQLVEKT